MNDFSGYLHSLDPFAIQLGQSFGIRWYGLSYLAGFILGYYIIRWLSRRKLSSLKEEQISDFVFWVAIGAVFGGRLGYCLFYKPELLLDFRASFPFWGGLAFNEGGMASHGGIAGTIIASYLFALRHKISFLHLIDLTTFGGAIGIFFGRLANFINGELVGRPCDPSFIFAVKFPQDMHTWGLDQISRLRDAVRHIGLEPEQWNALLKRASSDSVAWQQIQDIINQLIVAIQQGNPLVANAVEPLILARHPSQIYAALLEGLLVFVVLAIIWAIPRKPGVIAAWFLITYSVVRIFDEYFRLPDLHLGFQLLGLTRGQWLSIGMLAVGLIWLALASRRKVERMGGWRHEGT